MVLQERWLFPKNIGQLYERFLNVPIAFTLIYIFGGIFAGSSIPIIPQRIKDLLEKPLFRFLAIFGLSYTATGEVEYGLAGTVVYLAIMHLLRTPEERAKMPYGF